jgi:hypothetical protein
MSKRFGSLLLVFALTCALVGAFPGAESALGAPSAKIPGWAPDWMGTRQGGVSLDLALRQAREFDLIVAQPSQYRNFVAPMRAVNPALTFYVYRNAVAQNRTDFPDSYYAKTASGQRIRFPQWGTWEMNPKSSGWISELTSECRDLMASSGYGGCFLDVLGVSGVNSQDVTGLPVNPSTGRNYSQAEWMAATSQLARQVSTALAPRPVVGNGILAGFKYFDPSASSSVIMNGVRAGMVEAFARSAYDGASTYRNETMWKQDVDMLLAIAARPTGNIALPVTKVWSNASASQILSWQKYALATFLLGWVPGHAYFSFRSDKLLTTPSSLYDALIGTPAGSYAKINGVYQRTFTNGKVLVNPTTSTYTIQLGRSYRDTEGRVMSSITMTPHMGAILTKV